MVTVHTRVAELPAGIPVTGLNRELGEVTEAVPSDTVQVPVPGEGSLPERENEPLLHCVWVGPASATAAACRFVKITSSALGVHDPLLIVQRRVAEVPAGTPVTVLVAEPGVVIAAVPVIRVHRPVPAPGVFPESVKEDVLQRS